MTKLPALKYAEVKEKLMAMIGSMPPHSRLPSRPDLAVSFKAARTTVDRAVSELIGEGYLYSKDGSGTYASEWKAPAKAERTRAVGLLIPDIMKSIYPGILRGIEDVLSDEGYHLIVCNTDNRYDKQARYIHQLLDAHAAGLLIVPAFIGAADLSPFERIAAERMPYVLTHRGIEGLQAQRVVSNHFYAGYMAAKHLLDAGRKRVAYISRPLYSASFDRYQGYCGALRAFGAPLDERLVIFEEMYDDPHEGVDSTRRLLRSGAAPDALFCFNDTIARGSYQVLSEEGYRVGDDILLVGCDNAPICESLSIPLTSVKFPTYELGQESARQLLRLISRAADSDEPKQTTVVLQPELIVRRSSGGLD